MAEVQCFQIVRIVRRGPYFGEKAQIVFLPEGKDRYYKAQVYSSLQEFKLKRKDFVVLPTKRAR